MPPCRKRTGRVRKNRSFRSSKADWRETISRELEKAERLFVLGIGNRRKGDDAAGSLCVRLLEREIARGKPSADAENGAIGRPGESSGKFSPLEFQALDAGEAPESVTGFIREFRPSHVLIVDASLGGYQPGTVFVINKDEIRQEDISTHRLPLCYLVRYLEESIGCRVILVGIEPKETAWGRPVSVIVRAAAGELAEKIVTIAKGKKRV